MVKVWRLKIPKASCQKDNRHGGIEAASEDWQSIERPADQRKCCRAIVAVDKRYDGQEAYLLLLLYWLRLQLPSHRLMNWTTYSWLGRT